MSKKSAIEYVDSSINPTPGCFGCELYSPDPARNHCWAATLIRRWAGRKGWPKSFTEPEYFPGRIEKAIHWADLTGTDRLGKPWLNGYPRIIFVNDLGDTFAPNVPDPETWLLPLIPAMAASPHVWLFFTKWPRRMHDFFTAHEPPDNFWGLTSVTDQKTADARVRWLLKTPFSVRGVSAEPVLGELYLTPYLIPWEGVPNVLDWLLVGGESGLGARPMHPDYVRRLQQQGEASGTNFFLKQWGRWVDYHNAPAETRAGIDNGRWHSGYVGSTGHVVYAVGKHAAGRLLDGRTWDEMPQVPR